MPLKYSGTVGKATPWSSMTGIIRPSWRANEIGLAADAGSNSAASEVFALKASQTPGQRLDR
jgi:hypothetical protein